MPDIRHAITIEAPAEQVYPLVSTAAGMGQWWAEDVSDGATGVELGFFNRATVYRLQPGKMSSPHSTEWRCTSGKEWEGTRISFALEPKGWATELRFAHRDWKAETDYFISCNTTWGELMFRLKAAAEGKQPGPLFRKGSLAY
jgi:hypothetical protein